MHLDSELNQAWKEELREHSTMQAAVLSSGKKAMLKRWGWRVVRRCDVMLTEWRCLKDPLNKVAGRGWTLKDSLHCRVRRESRALS